MPASLKPLQLPTREPKSQGRPRKKPCIENEAKQNGFANNSASMIRTVGPCNQLVQKPMTDQGWILDENLLVERLVRPVQEFAKSVIETSSKVQEPKTYNEAINKPIHGNKLRKAVNKEL